jgi:bifunctional pyridoxal-dependent enzyme with beta-cystathionase and maltose regulon repressor activities
MQTLPLNTQTWDLELDSNGNLSLTDPDYSIAQDVASAIRTFLGECWYGVTLGMPYFQSILGKLPPASYITNMLEKAASTVPGVVSVTVVSLGLNKSRQLTGSVIVVSTDTNTPIVASF